MYNHIYEFCKIKNKGTVYLNGSEPTPRVNYLTSLLEEMGIEYELDSFPIIEHDIFSFVTGKRQREASTLNGFNIILRGTSDKMVIAHHDIVNPKIDNANDNSASVINAIMLKKLRPDVNVVLTDGEEAGGLGSERLAEQINAGEFGNIKWVLNLELTGKGGKYFFIGDYPGELQNHIKSLFDCPVVRTPYNDSITLRANGIDSVVINTLPPTTDEEVSNVVYEGVPLDFSIVFNCHNAKDSLDSIDINDMKEFVETVLIKII
jgi:hypothetical protein